MADKNKEGYASQYKKYNEQGKGNNLQYAVASMQGRRWEMEDAHSTIIGLKKNLSDWSYFAVFDGHCGEFISAYCAENLLGTIMKTDEFKNNDITNGIRNGFLNLDNEMRDLNVKCGSAAVCTFITPDKIFIGNCGDSRAVLCSSGKPILSTHDHQPDSLPEKKRIKAAGSCVLAGRLNGDYALSRAFGDYEYKNVPGLGQCEQPMSPEPEIFIHDRNFDNDEFLIIACDGIWDVMTNEELCNFIYSRLLITDDVQTIANQVVDTCLWKGSRDNMSIVLVIFPAAPKPNLEAQNKEIKLDMDIKEKLKEMIENKLVNRKKDMASVLHYLRTEDIPNLPPGGGISGKSETIKKTFLELCPDGDFNIYPYSYIPK